MTQKERDEFEKSVKFEREEKIKYLKSEQLLQKKWEQEQAEI